jgi:hypothetical protein
MQKDHSVNQMGIRVQPQLLEHLSVESLSHITHHPSCYVALAFFLQIAKAYRPQLQQEKLMKILQKMVSCF